MRDEVRTLGAALVVSVLLAGWFTARAITAPVRWLRGQWRPAPPLSRGRGAAAAYEQARRTR